MTNLVLGVITIDGSDYVATFHFNEGDGKDRTVTEAMKRAAEAEFYKNILKDVCSNMTPTNTPIQDLVISDETMSSHDEAAKAAWQKFKFAIEQPTLANQFSKESKNTGGKEVPLKDKLPVIKSIASCLKSTSKDAVIGGMSLGVRELSGGLQEIKVSPVQLPIGGASFLGLTGVSGLGTGLACMYDKYKEWNRAKFIGDQEGQFNAALDGASGGVGALSSGLLIGVKSFAAAQDIQMALHQPIAMAGALGSVQSAFSWALGITTAISMVLKLGQHTSSLISWVQGHQWRKELLEAKDPLEMLENEKMLRLYKHDMTEEEELKVGLEAGARWLQKIEREGGFKIQDRESSFKELILKYPQIISDLIGESEVPLTPEGELIRFGNYMAQKGIEAKFEADCMRKLGSDAVNAIKDENAEALKKALETQMIPKLTMKIAAAITGLLAVIILTIAMTGAPMGVLIVLAAIVAITMIYLYDWNELKNYLMQGEFKKRDKAFIYFTLALSIVSFVGVVGLTVLTGGIAPFVVSLIISAAWLGINSYSAFLLRRFEQRPWDVKKVVDRVTYLKFLKTEPVDRARLNDKLQDKKWVDMSLDQIKAEEDEEQKRLQEQLSWLKEQLGS